MTLVPTIPAQILALLKAGMPTPKAGQTLICKSATGGGTSYSTLHTVTAGKTFYLMGVNVWSTATSTQMFISLDSGTTNNLSLVSSRANYQPGDGRVISPGWPIGQAAAGATIQWKVLAAHIYNTITIWGYEE